MSKLREHFSRKARAGVRISRINILLIIVGLALSAGIIISTYRTADAFRTVYSTSDHYMVSQQTTGMLDTLSASMAEECRAFLADGDPAHTHAFCAQLDVLNGQLAASAASRSSREDTEADVHLAKALEAYQRMRDDEIRALRLAAGALPVPASAYPELLREPGLSEEDAALSPAQKKEASEALLSSASFAEARSLMEKEIDVNHRLNSEISRGELEQGQQAVDRVAAFQKLSAYLFIFFALLALIVNHQLLVRPLRRIVRHLDGREEIPLRGSYEIRRLADAYNSLREENSRKQEALAYTAAHDALTDVLNRGAFEDLYHSADLSGYGALIIADVDHFKIYNDNHGHDTGDRVLQAVARAIREHVRPEDLIYRIGGDEFVILLKNASRADADRLLDRIARINEKLSAGEDGVPCLTISAGIAFREDLEEGEDLFKCADIALLQVKERGRRGSAVYEK